MCNLQVRADGYETASCSVHLPLNAATSSQVCAMMSVKQFVEKTQTMALLFYFQRIVSDR